MATAGDQITRALRLLGVLAEGETASAETANDSLIALQQMLNSWSTERLAVFTTQTQTFTWPAGQITRSLGPTGDFIGLRPVTLDDSTYFMASNGVSYPIIFINQQQYDGIALKTATSPFPQVMFINMAMPDIEMSVYPLPTQDLVWHFVSVQELSQPPVLATPLVFPPGYMRAFAYGLACELAPEFGVEPSQQIQRIAMTSKRNLKRINNPGDVMAMPRDLVMRRDRFNIFTGSLG